MYNLLAMEMPAIVDIVSIAFILLFGIWGFIRGFTKTFFSVFGTIIALLVAVLLAPTIVKSLQGSFNVIENLSASVNGFTTKIVGEELMSLTLDQVNEGAIPTLGINGLLLKIVLSFKQDPTVVGTTLVRDVVNSTFAYYIVMIASFVVLFIVMKLIFFLIGAIVKKFYKVKIIAVVDRLLGLVIGIISGFVNLQLLFMVVSAVPIEFFQTLYTAITASQVANFVLSINVYEKIISAMSNINFVDIIKPIISK